MALQTPTTVVGAITATQTQITLTSGTGAAVGSYIKIDSEYLLIQSIANSPVLLVERGLGGTAAVAHAASANAIIGLPSDFGQPYAPVVFSYGANGALTVAQGVHLLNAVATTGVTFTLAAPTAAQIGMIMRILLTAAVASTVTNTTPGFINGGTSDDVASFAGAIGDSMEIIACLAGNTPYWHPTILKGVTLS